MHILFCHTNQKNNIERNKKLNLWLLFIKGWHPYPFCHVKCQSDVLGGWMGKTIFVMYCMTKWFQGRSHLKRKNIINKYKKYKVSMSVFHMAATWELLVLDGFLNSAFIISLWKKAPTSHFHSSQHVEKRWERNYVMCVYSFRNHKLAFQDRGACRYLQICSNLL